MSGCRLTQINNFKMAGLHRQSTVFDDNDLQTRHLNSMFEPEDVHLRYKILETIGKGAFGCVHKVQILETGDLCAMKTLPFDPTKSNRNLKREINSIAKLRNDVNFVQLLDVFKGTDNKLHMVMELCDEDLTAHMARNEIGQEEYSLFNIAQQLARGVNVLHSQDPPIVHRDIKPQNILIVRSGDSANDVIVKLADFGVSSSDIDMDSTHAHGRPILLTAAPIGTWPYMPPECFAALDGKGLKDGRFCFDVSLDIFALGLVYLYIFCYKDSRYGEFRSNIYD